MRSSTPRQLSAKAGAGDDAPTPGKAHGHHVKVHDDMPASFIDRVKSMGANAMLGAFVNTGDKFDRVLSDLRVLKISSGSVTCEVPVTKGICNSYGTLHGGATSTIVDVVGTMALLTVAPTKPGVSVEMSTSFTSAAKEGDIVTVEGRVLKSGARLGFTQVDLFRKSDGNLVASGRHTKAL